MGSEMCIRDRVKIFQYVKREESILAEYVRDTDSDGMPNVWEMNNFGDQSHNGSGDSDSDGLNDLEEYQNNTDPTASDTDNDGLNDGEEINNYSTNPCSGDTDSDGLPDGWEVLYGLNPLVNDAGMDPDGDGYTNLEEYQKGKNPNKKDDRLKPFWSGGCGFGGRGQRRGLLIVWVVVICAMIKWYRLLRKE